MPELLEEDEVGEGRFAQPVGEPLAFGDAEQIRDVPELLRLLLERCYQPRMGMSQRIDGDARGEIEILFTRRREQPRALAPLKSKVDARVSRQ